MLERRVVVKNALGLHARAAAQLVRMASKFRCQVTLTRVDNGVSANAKSILSVLHIAAAFGVELRICADGVDEKEAVDQIVKLFTDKFGED